MRDTGYAKSLSPDDIYNLVSCLTPAGRVTYALAPALGLVLPFTYSVALADRTVKHVTIYVSTPADACVLLAEWNRDDSAIYRLVGFKEEK